MMMFSTICKAVILFLLVCYFILRLRRKRLERLIDQFSGPPAYPLFGNINIATGSSSMILKKMMDMALTYRSPCAMWFFHKPHLIIYDPENFQIVMNKALNKGRLVGFLKQLLGNGLITIDDQEIWKKHRRQLNPAVSLKLMGRYYLKIFHCMNRTLVKEMNAFANTGEKINLWNFISERENRRIIRTMTDHNTETEEGAADSAKFWKGMRKGFWSVIRRMHSPLLYPQEINRLFTQIIGGSATFEGVRELPQKIIDNRRAQMRNIADNNAESKDETIKQRPLIDILLDPDVSALYDDRGVVDEIITFLDAGSITTSTNLCFTMLMLAMHQDHQNRVYQELKDVLGDEEYAGDLEKYDKLIYLEQCITETLRLFPSVPFITRHVDQDVTLKDGRVIPEGTGIFLGIYFLHRNPQVYPNPEVWDPNRFHSAEVAKRHPYSFAAFSGGPRNCPGYNYALLSMKSLLAAVLQKYHLTTNLQMPDIKLGFDNVLRNETGHQVFIHRRINTSKDTCLANTV